MRNRVEPVPVAPFIGPDHRTRGFATSGWR
jgi:hypothetical protein